MNDLTDEGGGELSIPSWILQEIARDFLGMLLSQFLPGYFLIFHQSTVAIDTLLSIPSWILLYTLPSFLYCS